MSIFGNFFTKKISLKDATFSIFIFLYVFLFYHNAWLSDDSFITFRVVDNFLNGYGLRWNPVERVQVFTHPLWLFLLVPVQAFIRDISWTAYLLSFVCGILLLLLWYFQFRKSEGKTAAGTFLFTILFCSKTYFDYNTSGLENPLSFVLLLCAAIYFVRCLQKGKTPDGEVRRDSLALGFLIACLALTRLDLILFFVIPLPFLFFKTHRENRIQFLKYSIIGIFPWFLYLCFSTVYYGSPLPNTFYAKTNVVSPLSDRLVAGWNYVRIGLRWDPVASIVFFVHLSLMLVEVLFRSFSKRKGILNDEERIYLFVGGASVFPVPLYLLWIGGDFMSGRFLGTCLIVSLFVLAKIFSSWSERNSVVAKRIGFLIYTIVAFVFFISKSSPFRNTFSKNEVRLESGVVDEAASYRDDCSLKSLIRGHSPDSHPWARYAISLSQAGSKIGKNATEGGVPRRFAQSYIRRLAADPAFSNSIERVQITTNVGLAGYYGGPKIHWIDLLGITDPFLARLPGKGFPGHYIRLLPEGYKEFIEETSSSLSDPDLDRFFYEIRLLSEEDLWTEERFAAIFDFSFRGRGNFLTRFPKGFRYPFVLEVYRSSLYGIPFVGTTDAELRKRLESEYFLELNK
ncbi:hypothetical protein EHQ12_01360 [Leptospira gomenensis]|uniref:Glycosyltransferase RgtA/B/C/D-like domain-containing protein n=1 Tax=Leptospira gomenensis TaxID=2484974 RepID=A0A5F1YAP1_9LEPT|nr:hypothetical protein [Leptospira gomenensis]TGK34462.1 hypothetical protein EHQ17_08525 [Leptospira gomenensis]TGK41848.1 hypothetical protein EHQ07_15495 [Leptospira gomenensis]TGK44785.1 hypothetical protein EHQ12_01360 [Leptospira gomenensis]TGK65172.1 hypothetical protein EHQ13_05875 [Leptospira gomenensis]